MGDIVTAKEVGQYLKLSESTIYKLAAEGELPGFKIGDSWRFDMNDITNVIKAAKREKTDGVNAKRSEQPKKPLRRNPPP